ncbi:MAG: HD domain-containing protein [Planctomycetes bacterium]|nr:HD domain-containing protein [Planctomycetota bacterium]
MTTSSVAVQESQKLLGSLPDLLEQLRQVGVSAAVFDASGACVSQCMCATEACGRICGADGPCRGIRAEALQQAWTDGEPAVLAGPAGCAVMAVPVKRRRRTVAVALACFLTDDQGATEAFARACDRLRLDRPYMASLIGAAVTHPAGEAPSWATLIRAMLTQGVENAVARTELASFSTSLSTTYEELSLLYRLSGAMKVNVTPQEFFHQVCAELMEVVQVASATAVLNGRAESNQKDYVARAGHIALNDNQMRALCETIRANELKHLDDGSRGVVFNEPSVLGAEYAGAIANLVAVPLTAGDLYMGMVLTADKAGEEFDSSDLKLIHSVAVQAAVFLANHHLYGEVQGLLMGVLHVLTASIDAKDQYTCGHSQRVAMISRKLGEMCGFDRQRVENLYLAGLLHDIGKIGVPESVLCKPGKLSSEEFDMMRRHPVIGANILSNIRQIQTVMPGVLYHHERIDGRGYPEGLAGGDLPIEGRIVGLADSFDAMTSSRTYRKAMPLAYVIAEIMRCSGTQFDPVLVDHLLGLDLEAFLTHLREAKPILSAVTGMLEAGADGSGPRMERVK